MPTQASPLRTYSRWVSAQPMFRSSMFDGLSISTQTVPLARRARAGRRTSTRVAYGASGVRTTAPLASGQP
jgi:hypothetical protein